MLDEAVGKAEVHDRHREARRRERLRDGFTGTAGHDVLLDGDEEVVPLREIVHQ